MSLPLLGSRVIPAAFSHGFTTRAGGVSGGPYASLNLGYKWGDEPGCVDENRRRLRVASRAQALHLARQVHGAAVASVEPGTPEGALAAVEADAVVARGAGQGAAVIVADCVPVLLADPVTGAVGAVHAGWRGTAANVVGAAVRALCAAGSRPEDLRAAMGPSIGPCCFEVGDDVVQALRRLPCFHPELIRIGARGRPHADLWQTNQRLLVAAGLRPHHVERLDACTHCDPQRFFSYRREGSTTGQMMAFIVAAAP